MKKGMEKKIQGRNFNLLELTTFIPWYLKLSPATVLEISLHALLSRTVESKGGSA